MGIRNNWQSLGGRGVVRAIGNIAAIGCMTPFASGIAHAQAAAPVQNEASHEASSGQIEEIIVSARRRREAIQDTPVAMTAISTAQLEAKGSVSIADLQGAAPNVQITPQGTGAAAANISIRGLAFADIEKSFDPTVAVVSDGIFVGTSTGQLLDFFDVASIEILRGPQGTLFGRNTIGGVINVRRTRPTGEFGGKFELGYGRFDALTGRAVLNAPIIKDVLAAKFFYFHSESEGYYRKFLDGKRSGASNNENFGLSLLFTPSSNFSAQLTLEKQVQRYDAPNSEISQSGELFCLFLPAAACNRNPRGKDLYTSFEGLASLSDGKPFHGNYSSPAATLEMNLNVGSVDLVSITGYRDSDEYQTQDFATLGLYDAQRVQTYYQFSQELRASGKLSDAFDYVAGVYFFKSRYTLAQNTWVFGTNTGAPSFVTGRSQSYAGFADFNWNFAPRLRLSFGGRYTHDKKQLRSIVGTADFGPQSASWNKFTPKVSIDYRPNDDLMVYATWSRGYRAGGFNGRGLTPLTATTPFDPETVDSFELGLKSSWFDRRLTFNLAGFYTRYKNMQQSTTIPGGPTGNQTLVTNVGQATVKGIELDFTGKPARELTIRGGVGLLDANFKGFLVQDVVPGGFATFDYSSNDLIYAPKFNASISLEYATETSLGGFRVNGSYRYLDDFDQQISKAPTVTGAPGSVVMVPGNDPRVRSDKANLVDASISFLPALADGRMRITAYGRNLLDDRGPIGAFTVAGLWTFAAAREPRTYGIQVGYEF